MAEDPAALFGAAMRRMLEQMESALEAAYRADGLDFRPRFTPILRAVAEDGPLTIRDLARQLGLSHSAISQTVAQMAARGLLEIRPGTDARQRLVSPSPAALALLPRLRRHWQAAAAATRGLADEIGGDLVATVGRANAALAERPFIDRLRAASPDK